MASAEAPARAHYGEATNGLPVWGERVLHQWINRARVDPQTELAGCGSNCSSAELSPTCYTPQHPLSWDSSLGTAAHFHSESMVRMGFFAHSTPCVLRTDLASVYPGSCDGSAACACSGDGSTSFSSRVGRFGASGSGEIIAGYYSDPVSAFYGWLYEPAPSSSCSFDQNNGHRYLILKNSGPGLGGGVFSSYYTVDFGSGPPAPKIPSGAHYPQQGSTIEFWANWYDSAGPSAARVVIDGLARDLTLARGTTVNGAWTATASGLETGCHRYYFEFVDATGNPTTYPSTGSYGIGPADSCPDWSPVRSGRSARIDFDGDARSDLFWRNTSGANAIWFMDGTSILTGAFTTSLDRSWFVAGTGDFDGNGRQDVLWRHDSGINAVWLMEGSSIAGSAFVESLPSGWSVEATGDFNGDGRADLLWRHISGLNAIWLMNGTSIGASAFTTSLEEGWTIAASGDFSGDGRTDLVWRHSTGLTACWLMNGAAITSSAFLPSLALEWSLSAAGDFDGDGRSDLLWRHASGLTAMWFMMGTTVQSGGYTESVDPSVWALAASGDYDRDGRADLFWRHTSSGQTAVWLMNGTSILSSGLTAVVEASWSPAPDPATGAGE